MDQEPLFVLKAINWIQITYDVVCLPILLPKNCLILLITVACGPGSYGQVVVSSFAEIKNGEYIEEQFPQCMECPVGTYQQNEGQSNCASCPVNQSTSRLGSKSNTDCQGMLNIAM